MLDPDPRQPAVRERLQRRADWLDLRIREAEDQIARLRVVILEFERQKRRLSARLDAPSAMDAIGGARA